MSAVRSKGNPFARSPQYWKVLFTVPAAAVATAENAFDDFALAVSGFETDEEKQLWTFDLLFKAKPDMSEVQRRLFLLSKMHSIPVPKATMEKVEDKDWLKATAQSFPPLSIGRFYVHGSHVKEAPPSRSVRIQIDAGAAFGSGEHGTTRCCLEALDWLAKRRRFKRVLDMGCGSGILAIAAAKLWKPSVLAVDIDPVAVRVTQTNTRLNRVGACVDCAESDGYQSKRVKRAGKFDLIVSNILARPLVQFAPDLKQHLSRHGVAVLSGLLSSQETQVLSAHLMQGLKLTRKFTYGEWCTLVLTR